MSKAEETWSFTYNADGLRTQKTNGTTTYNYTYNGSSLSQMTVGSDTLRFFYDANGVPVSVDYNGTTYYYATNVQGDVMAILDANGTEVARYVYDAWGRNLAAFGTLQDTLGTHNPLRYRGYVYDVELKLYYLQSRYYNPYTGRFINADALVSTGQGLLGNNMFTYCNNSPIIFSDSSGYIIEISDRASKEDIEQYERAIAYLKTSKTGAALIERLENSKVVFTIEFNHYNDLSYCDNTKTINFDPYSGMILTDGRSVQSPAIGLAHEMGHAALNLENPFFDIWGFDEFIVLNTLETPIAKELGEPIRNEYYDGIYYKRMNNSTHYRIFYEWGWILRFFPFFKLFPQDGIVDYNQF